MEKIINGNNFEVLDIGSISMERKLSLQYAIENIEQKVAWNHIDDLFEAIIKDNLTLDEIKRASIILQELRKFDITFNNVGQICACVILLNNENPLRIDQRIHAKKLELFEKDKGVYDFFLSTYLSFYQDSLAKSGITKISDYLSQMKATRNLSLILQNIVGKSG